MALAGITAVGEFHYLHHGPGGVPLRRPERDGAGAGPGGGGRRHPAHPARRLLPGRRSRARRLPAAGPGAARFSDGDRRGVAGAAWSSRSSRAWRRCGTTLDAGAALHSVRAVPPERLRRPGRRLAERTAARPPVRAARRERGLPGRPRADPDRPAGRARPARAPAATAVHGDPPHRRGRRPPRHGAAHTCLRLPDHRGRPRRRHRAVRRAAWRPARRSASAPTSTSRSTCWPRRSGSTSTSGCGPAGGRPSARVPAGRPRRRPGSRVPRATEAGGWRRGRPATSSRPSDSAPRTAGAAPTRPCSPAPRRHDVHDVVWTGWRSSRDGQHRLGDVGRLLAEAIEPLWADL